MQRYRHQRLILLEYGDQAQAWIGYKESSGSANAAFKVNRYYHMEWMPPTDLPLKLDGLTLDAVYENFVRQIAGDALESARNETLKESVDRSELKTQLEKTNCSAAKEDSSKKAVE